MVVPETLDWRDDELRQTLSVNCNVSIDSNVLDGEYVNLNKTQVPVEIKSNSLRLGGTNAFHCLIVPVGRDAPSKQFQYMRREDGCEDSIWW